MAEILSKSEYILLTEDFSWAECLCWPPLGCCIQDKLFKINSCDKNG